MSSEKRDDAVDIHEVVVAAEVGVFIVLADEGVEEVEGSGGVAGL